MSEGDCVVSSAAVVIEFWGEAETKLMGLPQFGVRIYIAWRTDKRITIRIRSLDNWGLANQSMRTIAIRRLMLIANKLHTFFVQSSKVVEP